jgi:hypothetical protein
VALKAVCCGGILLGLLLASCKDQVEAQDHAWCLPQFGGGEPASAAYKTCREARAARQNGQATNP